MPMAAPLIASSERGVPKTRSGPKRSRRPRVVPWIAFGSSTSSPKTITDSSRSISCSAASRTASTNDSVRSTASRERFGLSQTCGEGIRILPIDIRHEFVGVRKRACLGERECLSDFRIGFSFDGGANAGRKFGGETEHGVGGKPRFHLAFFPEAEMVIGAGADVFAPAIGVHFEKPGAFAGAKFADYFGGAAGEADDIASVETFGRQSKCFGPSADVRLPLTARLRSMD